MPLVLRPFAPAPDSKTVPLRLHGYPQNSSREVSPASTFSMPLLRIPASVAGHNVPAPVPRPDGGSNQQCGVHHNQFMDSGASAKTFGLQAGQPCGWYSVTVRASVIPAGVFLRQWQARTGGNRDTAANQSLRHHARQTGREQERLPPISCKRVIAPTAVLVCSVEVPGVRSVKPEQRFLRFRYRGFTDHHHIRVLTQNCAQATGDVMPTRVLTCV